MKTPFAPGSIARLYNMFDALTVSLHMNNSSQFSLLTSVGGGGTHLED
jgi:hypothetical protein